jgi:hypothetical protein
MVKYDSPSPAQREEMARKVVNRKALREEVEAAEKAGVKKKAAKKKKKATKRASRSKEPVEVRKKVFWGVFNQSLKRVATFEFNQKKEAQAKADALSQSGKSVHFVQKVKEIIEE